MATKLQEFKNQYPQYADADDDKLTQKLHQFNPSYAKIPYEEFRRKVNPSSPERVYDTIKPALDVGKEVTAEFKELLPRAQIEIRNPKIEVGKLVDEYITPHIPDVMKEGYAKRAANAKITPDVKPAQANISESVARQIVTPEFAPLPEGFERTLEDIGTQNEQFLLENSRADQVANAWKFGEGFYGISKNTSAALSAYREARLLERNIEKVTQGTGLAPEAVAERIARLDKQWQENIAKNPAALEELKGIETSPVMQRAMSAKGTKEAAKIIALDPGGFLIETVVTSLPASLRMMVAGAIGAAAAGAPGAGLAIGGASGKIDFTHELTNRLSEAGVDVSNEQEIASFLENSPDEYKEILDKSLKHATGVGAFDALSGVISVRALARGVKGVAKSAVTEGVLGATGEAVGTKLAGEEQRPGELMAEFSGEVVTGPISAAGGALVERLKADPVAEQEFVGDVQEMRKELDSAKEEFQALQRQAKTLEDEKIVEEKYIQENEKILAKWAKKNRNLGEIAQDLPGLPISFFIGEEAGLNSGFDTLSRHTAASVNNPQPSKAGERLLAQFPEIAQMQPGSVIATNPKYEQMGGVLSEWVRMFAPEMKIVLGDPEEMGYSGYLGASQALGMNNTFAIAVNPRGVIEEGRVPLAAVAHEFAHTLNSQLLGRQPPQTLRAVYQEYLRDLEAFSKSNQGEQARLRGFEEGTKRKQKQVKIEDPVKGDRQYLLSFPEWFARRSSDYFLGNAEPRSAIQRVMANIAAVLARFYRRFGRTYKPAETIEAFFENVRRTAKRNTIQEKITSLQGGVLQNAQEKINVLEDKLDKFILSDVAGSKVAGVSKTTLGDLRHSKDKFNWMYKHWFNLLQLGKVNLHNKPLQEYIKFNNESAKEATIWKMLANERLADWREIAGNSTRDDISVYFTTATIVSDLLQRKLTAAEKAGDFSDELLDTHPELEFAAGRLKRHTAKFKSEHWDFITRVEEDFRRAIGYDPTGTLPPSGLYEALQNQLKEKFSRMEDSDVLNTALKELREKFAMLVDRNYFPLSRFGKYAVTVKARKVFEHEGQVFQEGDIVEFITTEKKHKASLAAGKSQQEIANQVLEQYGRGSVAVSMSELDDDVKAYLQFPPQLLQLISNNLKLTTEQKQQLLELSDQLSPLRGFQRQLQNRKGTRGFNDDAMRAYASYFMHFGNFMARVKWVSKMEEQHDLMSRDINFLTATEEAGAETLPEGVRDLTTRSKIREYVGKHLDYIKNPGNEFAGLRYLGFVFFLGFVPKAAYVNLTQIPMMFWGYASSNERLGGGKTPGYHDMKSAKTIAGAIKDVARAIRAEDFKHPAFTGEESVMLQELIKRDILDQSFATELAGVIEGERWINSVTRRSKLQKGMEYSSALFQYAEKVNRRVAALASYRLARKNKLTHSEAVEEAYKSVEQTMFEYGRHVRASGMRGGKAPFFLFAQFITNSLWFLFNSPGNIRYLAMLMLAAGVQGLPGAEEAMDIYNFLARQLKKLVPNSDPHSDIRKDLREMFINMDVNPDLMMHGLGRYYGLGPFHALELLGFDVPNTDISASLSMGRIDPLGIIQFATHMDLGKDAMLASAQNDVGGALITQASKMLQVVADGDLTNTRKLEYAMAGQIKNLLRANRWWQDGYETTWNGAVLTEITGAEAFAQAMGFPITRVQQIKEARWHQQEAAIFYANRQKVILDGIDVAIRNGDKEQIRDALDARTAYNKSVPYPSLMITNDGIRTSISRRADSRGKQEAGIPHARKDITLYKEIGDAFPVTTENIR